MGNRPKGDELLKMVALRYCAGMDQISIGDQLGVSQSTVSAKLAEARKWIREERHFVGPLTGDESARLSLHKPTQDLISLLEKRKKNDGWKVPEVHSFYGGATEDTEHWDKAVVNWSANAASKLMELLLQANSIGIALGRTMRAVVDSLAFVSSSSRRRKSIQVFPLRGPRQIMWREEDDDYFVNPHQLTANSLATDLNRLINATSNPRHASSDLAYALRWHLTVPELIGFKGDFSFQRAEKGKALEKMLQSEREFVEQFIVACSVTDANRLVFGAGTGGGLCESVEAILVPIASSGTTRSLTPFQKEFAGIPPEWPVEKTLGDIGTIPLPRAGIDYHDLMQLERIRNRQPGIKIVHLTQCAERARKEPSRIGVIGCAVGEREAAVQSCIELGIVNHLFIDYGCAERLLERLEKTKK